ncbi:MAG: hypothetical protein MUP98_01525 [Candidatus Aminicenantes bacterium]|nr:hypothetical protein [Candidatus Aminicenantes bacterium]
MKLSKQNKELLVKEIKFVLEKMHKEEDSKSKLYYFSAIFGLMHRIYNLEYSSDLVFAHFVLSSIHSQINAGIQNPDKTIKIPVELFQKLEENTGKLLNAIEKDENLYEVLKKYSVLGYVTNGNGYYLYQRGKLKL